MASPSYWPPSDPLADKYNHGTVSNGARNARYGQAVCILDFRAKWHGETLALSKNEVARFDVVV